VGRPLAALDEEGVVSSELYGGQDPGALGRHPNSQRFHDLLAAIGELHDRKQQDYGRDDDPFFNVRAGAHQWGVDPWIGALMRAGDKMARLQVYAKTGTLANEGAEDSFMDLAVYALIGLVLWKEEHEQEASSKSSGGIVRVIDPRKRSARVSGDEHDNAHAPATEHTHGPVFNYNPGALHFHETWFRAPHPIGEVRGHHLPDRRA